jgi:hypothetical protein
MINAGRASSRPASILARAGGPLTRLTQEYVTNRYVRHSDASRIAVTALRQIEHHS